MSILEFAEQRRSTGGAIKQAKREMREEAKSRRAARDAGAEAEANVGLTSIGEFDASGAKDGLEEQA